MAIEITLYKMTEDPRKINKTLPNTSGTYLNFSTSWLKDAFNVMDPDVTLSSSDDLTAFNYMKVGAPVNRYFFIRPEIIRTELFRLNAHEDVLQVFQAQIKQQSGILDRSETIFNTYLSDSMFDSLSYRRVQTILFTGTPFSSAGNGYYLATLGGAPASP